LRLASYAGALAIAYFAISWGSLLFVEESHSVAVIWPASGVALAAFLAVARRHWPVLLLAVFVGNLVAQLLARGPSWPSFALAAVNALEPLLAAGLFQSIAGRSVAFLPSLRQVVGLVGAATIANGLTALAGATTVAVAFEAPLVRAWVTWLLADGLGMLVVAPVLLALTSQTSWGAGGDPVSRRSVIGFALVGAVVTGAIFFTDPHDFAEFHDGYWLFPWLLWGAIRFGSRTTSIALLFVAVTSSMATVRGLGPFAPFGLGERVVALQGYLAVLIITALLVSAVMLELEDARRRRQRAREAELSTQKAFEIHDSVVQRLAIADLAFSMDRTDEAREAVHEALVVTKRIISDWAVAGVDLTRSQPATPPDDAHE
jgi:integral membrane sensor domain MASE1